MLAFCEVEPHLPVIGPFHSLDGARLNGLAAGCSFRLTPGADLGFL